MKEIVIATSNPGKLEEFKEMLKDMEVELHYLAEWPGIEAPEENGRTFAANARLKATYYAKATGMTCIADDSGLEVQALDGEPGVRSARYAGEKATDKENNDLLLANMKLQVKRTCRFRCALCVADAAGKVLTLDLSGSCGAGRTVRRMKLDRLDTLDLFLDGSALEAFVNEGEAVLASRIFGQSSRVAAVPFAGRAEFYPMRPIIIEDCREHGV